MEQYTVTGMSCAACSARVEKAVAKVPGVTSCSVSLLTNSMGVEGSAPEQEIIKAVEEAVRRCGEGSGGEEPARGRWGRRSVKGPGDAGVKAPTVRFFGIFAGSHVFFHGTYDVELARSGLFCG